MDPVVGVDGAPDIAPSATEAYTESPALPISVPKQISAGACDSETLPTVSDHGVLTIFVANYWSFSTCLPPPLVRHRPRCLMPYCKYPPKRNKISP